MNDLTHQGIAAIKAGNRTAARQMLMAAVEQNPNDAMAWLWLTGTVEQDEDRIACLEQVLRIDPANQAANRGMAQILERRNRTVRAEPAGQPAQPVSASETAIASASEPEPIQVVLEKEPVQAEPAPPDQAPPPAARDAAGPAQSMVEAQTEDQLPDVSSETGNLETVKVLTNSLTDEGVPTVPPIRRPKARAAADPTAQLVFRSRPSLVPALLCFWIFLFGTIAVASLLSSIPDIGLPFAAGLGFILEVIVLYAILRTVTVRYELTNQQLTLRFRGKRARIPITDIYTAVCVQSYIQRLLDIGNINIDANVDGQLAHLQMKNIPQCQLRAEQIEYLVKGQSLPG